jgi:O-antigen/teichoic acid export membrane protein
MGVIIRQSIATTIISYVGLIIGYLNLLYLYPLFLSPDQVGLMRTVQDAAILMAQFAQFGLAQSVIRYFPRFLGDTRKSQTFINLIIAAAVVAFGFFLVVYFLFEQPILGYFQTNAQEFVQYAGLVLWLAFITVMTTLMEVYSRSLLRNILPNLLKEVIVRLLLAGAIIVYAQGMITFPQLVVSTMLIYVVCLLILMMALAFQGHLSLSFDANVIEPSMRKDMIRFSFLSFAGTAGLIIVGKVDSIMVAGLLGLAPVAIYSIAFYMATVIEIPKRAMTQVASPLISRAFEKNDMVEVQKIYHKTALNQFILGTLLLLGVVANLDSIFHIMPKGDIYEAGRYVVVLVGIGKLVDMLFGPSSEIIVYSKYYAFSIVLILLLAMALIVGNNILIPLYGIRGAAIGSALAFILFNAVKFVFIWAKFKLQPFSAAFVKVILITSAAWFAQGLIPSLGNVFIDIALRSGVITLVYGFLILGWKVSPDANTLVVTVLRQVGIGKRP